MIDGTDRQQADEDEILIEEAPTQEAEADDGAGQQQTPDELATLRAAADKHRAEQEAASAREQAAARELADLRSKLEQEVNARTNASEVAIGNAIASWTQERDNLTRAYSDALKAGNHAQAAEINDRLLDAKLNLRQAEGQRQQLTTYKQQIVQQAEQAQKQRQDDPLAQFEPQTRQWLERHPDAKPGGKDWDKAFAAHNLAVVENIRPNTTEYFDFIEQRLGYKEAPVQQPNPAPAARQAPQSTAVPPSRGNGAGGQRTPPSTIKLTASERDIASRMTSLGDSVEDRIKNYARNKKAAIERGEIPGAAA